MIFLALERGEGSTELRFEDLFDRCVVFPLRLFFLFLGLVNLPTMDRLYPFVLSTSHFMSCSDLFLL